MKTPNAILLPLLCAALPAQSGWSAPTFVTELNTAASDTGPHLSLDGLTLHFSSFRSGNWEIWSATRSMPGGTWTAPVLETGLSDPAAVDDQPFLSADGLQLWLGSSRPGGTGSTDILMSTRPNTSTPWSAPTWVIEVNSTGADSSPSLTADGLECYFLSTGHGNPGGNNNSAFRAMRPSTAVPFGTPALLGEFYNGNTHRDCEVSPDGLSIVFTEFFGSRLHVMRAERTSRLDALGLPVTFGAPVEWTEFASVGASTGVFSFTLSVSGNEAFLAAGFPPAQGSQEIMTARFDGLTHFGVATASSSMTLVYRDSQSPGGFYVMGAALGNTGFMLGTRLVPLDPDFLLIGTLGVSVPPWSAGFAGLLDGGGEGTGSLTNAGSFLLGFPPVYIGAFTFDTTSPFGVKTISNSFPMLFQ